MHGTHTCQTLHYGDAVSAFQPVLPIRDDLLEGAAKRTAA